VDASDSDLVGSSDRNLNPQANVRGWPSGFEKVLVYWAFVSSHPYPSPHIRVRPRILVSNWLANWVGPDRCSASVGSHPRPLCAASLTGPFEGESGKVVERCPGG
jgi:hypothetical protein